MILYLRFKRFQISVYHEYNTTEKHFEWLRYHMLIGFSPLRKKQNRFVSRCGLNGDIEFLHVKTKPKWAQYLFSPTNGETKGA